MRMMVGIMMRLVQWMRLKIIIIIDDLQVIEGAEAGDRGEYQCEVPTMMMMMMVVVVVVVVVVGCISTRCKVFFNPKKKTNFSGFFFLRLIGLRDPGDPIS